MLTTTKLIFGAIGYALCKNINKVDNSSLVKNANRNKDYERLSKENKELKTTADDLRRQVNAANIRIENDKTYSAGKISQLEEDVKMLKGRNEELVAQINTMESDRENTVTANAVKENNFVKENPYVKPPTETRRRSTFWY